jgi:hypothetical protein
VVNDAMAQQRPILHQAKHGIFLSVGRMIQVMRDYDALGPAPLASRQ